MDYRKQATECVKDTVLPLHARRFRECGGDLDLMYMKYGDTAAFFAKILLPRGRPCLRGGLSLLRLPPPPVRRDPRA